MAVIHRHSRVELVQQQPHLARARTRGVHRPLEETSRSRQTRFRPALHVIRMRPLRPHSNRYHYRTRTRTHPLLLKRTLSPYHPPPRAYPPTSLRVVNPEHRLPPQLRGKLLLQSPPDHCCVSHLAPRHLRGLASSPPLCLQCQCNKTCLTKCGARRPRHHRKQPRLGLQLPRRPSHQCRLQYTESPHRHRSLLPPMPPLACHRC